MLYKKVTAKRIFLTSVLAAIFVLLLVASKDLGGALLYFMAYLILIYVNNVSTPFSLYTVHGSLS